MNDLNEKDLEQVSGGGFSEIINTNDVLGYIKVLAERPGIVDRLRASALTDEDVESILTYFVSENRFILTARFAYDRTVEELITIAAANDQK